LLPLDFDAPVCHVSYYEADAFAKFSNARLPTEQEWEVAANQYPPQRTGANLLESGLYHPAAARTGDGLRQMLGDVWQWTSSSYLPYPGYKPYDGPLAEYNGKFMVNQMVLRGGGCATPREHIRTSYRNFFQPEMRWQFSGIRLAKDA
jgi:ergothioneine biosynthesis protein EgtB